jgi:hypothetical protein
MARFRRKLPSSRTCWTPSISLYRDVFRSASLRFLFLTPVLGHSSKALVREDTEGGRAMFGEARRWHLNWTSSRKS